MNQKDIDLLKTKVDQSVQLHCTDGEVIVGTLLVVSDDERDVVYDLISSNRQSRYDSFIPGGSFRIPFDEIAFVTVPEPGSAGSVADYPQSR